MSGITTDWVENEWQTNLPHSNH